MAAAFSAHQVADILQHLVEIEVDVLDRQLAGLDLGEIEDVVDDAEQVLAGALDLEHVIALARREVGLEREMGQADDGVHRGSDLVAHIGEEHALGLAGLQRRRGRLLELFLRGLKRLLGGLARVDVAPRADHLDRAAALVADEMLLVADPAIGAVLLAEAIFGEMLARSEQLDLLRFDFGEILGMHVATPEIGILQVFLGAIAQHRLDTGADEGGREIAGRGETVDHHRGRAEQQHRAARARARAAASASLRSVMSVHDPTISTGLPFASRTTCCWSFTQK